MLAGQAFRISSQSPLRETRRSTSVSILGIELGRKVIAGFGRDERRGEGQTALCVERDWKYSVDLWKETVAALEDAEFAEMVHFKSLHRTRVR